MVLQARTSAAFDLSVKHGTTPAMALICYCAYYRLLRHTFAHQMVLLFMHQLEDQMRTTVTLDDDLLAKAIKLTGASIARQFYVKG